MAIIQVRDVPDDVQQELVRRARAAGQSLQQYLRGLLVTQARRPDPSSFWAEVARRTREERTSYDIADAVDDVRGLRDEDRRGVTAVTDTSVVIPALVDGGSAGETARAALSVPDLIAPALIDVEVLSALRGRVRGQKLAPDHAGQAIHRLRRMPLQRFDMLPLVDRIWQLRENLTAYDAAYVALAEVFDAVLITADQHLVQSSGPRCAFSVVSTH